MGYVCAVITAVLAIIIYKIVTCVRNYSKVPPIPKLEEIWWGPGERSEEDTSIQPFTINVSDEVLKDLKHRLENARPLTPPLEGIQHQYGLNTNLLTKIVEFWRTKYNWREREKFLNKFPQFTVNVQGLRIHYLHVKPENPEGLKVLPLLLLHGWPGSIREFYEIIPILTSPQPGYKFVFEVIAPSLPGYGFSEAAVRPGLGVVNVAVLFSNFMKRIGFEKYYVQGGDWGAGIGQNLATLFPNEVIGLHSNMCLVNSFLSNLKLFLYSFYPTLLLPAQHVNKVYPLSEKFGNLILETGYMHIQSTKPDTVGVALNDSPVGLAAYILEKFITWTNPSWKELEDGGLERKYKYENLLDDVMIYWITNSITTSVRLYAESFSKAEKAIDVSSVPVTVPTAVARFSYELMYQPKKILEEKHKNIVYESDYEGGHFAAFEVPEILGKDIFAGVHKIELYHTYKVET